jgi:hypothetical protein
VVVILLCGVVAFVSAKYLTSKLLSLKSPTDQSEGFDFNILNSGKPETGPKVGERIDLDRLKGPGGKSLADTIGERPAVIVAVDPLCGMCRESADEMRDIRTRVAPSGVQYYLVAFSTPTTPSDFFKFADSLNTGAQACLWSTNEGEPPRQLSEMLVPSHFLIDRNGVVIKKWPGSSATESVRRRMANQIVTDTLDIISMESFVSPK